MKDEENRSDLWRALRRIERKVTLIGDLVIGLGCLAPAYGVYLEAMRWDISPKAAWWLGFAVWWILGVAMSLNFNRR